MATYHNENRIGFNYDINPEELRSQRRFELENARMRSVEEDYNDDWDNITAYLDSKDDRIDLKSSKRSSRSPSTIKSSSQQTPSESDSAEEEADKKLDKADRFASIDSIHLAKRVSYENNWLGTSVFSLQLASNAKVIKKTENTVALNHYHGTHVKMKFLLTKPSSNNETTSLYLAKSLEEAQQVSASSEHTHVGYLDLRLNDQQIIVPDDFPIKEFIFEEPERISPTFIIINRHNNFKCNKNHLRQALTQECSFVSIQLHVASRHDPTVFVPQFPVLVVHLTGTYHSSEPRGEVVKSPQKQQAPKPPKPPKVDGKTTKYLESLKEMVNWLKTNPQIDHDTSEQFTQLFAEGFLQFNNAPLLPATTYYPPASTNDVYSKATQMDLDHEGDFSFNIAEF